MIVVNKVERVVPLSRQ